MILAILWHQVGEVMQNLSYLVYRDRKELVGKVFVGLVVVQIRPKRTETDRRIIKAYSQTVIYEIQRRLRQCVRGNRLADPGDAKAIQITLIQQPEHMKSDVRTLP